MVGHYHTFKVLFRIHLIILKFLEQYINNDLNFEFGENTDPYNGCSAMLNGQMYYFGGGGRQGDSKQVQLSLKNKLM